MAELYHSPGVAVDAAGDLFIADRNNSRIRKVDAQGTITTVAGGGGPPDGLGDGGPASAAALDQPFGVAVDAEGDLFIADTDNHRIRKVFGVTAPAKPLTTGDVDGDGKEDLKDASLALRYVVGLIPLSADQLNAADLNGDGNINLRDVVLLLRRADGA